MGYMYYYTDSILSRLLTSQGSTAADFVKADLGVLPRDSLPHVRRVLPARTKTHPRHFLLPGRYQLTSLPDRHIVLPDGSALISSPSSGQLWVNDAIRELLSALNILEMAHLGNDDAVWQHLGRHFNHGTVLPGLLPILWTVHLAAAEANVGRVVELIRHTDNARFYAAFLLPAVFDAQHMLFHGQILGAGPHSALLT